MADLVGSATIRVTADTTAARRAILGLQRLSPIRIAARVNVPTAGITAAAAALRDLRDNSGDTSRALTTLGPQAASTASDLRDLAGPAQQVSQELRTLRTRATAAARALEDLGEQAMQAAMALRVLITTTSVANRHLDSLRDRTRAVRDEMEGLRTSVGSTSDGLRSIGDDSEGATRRLGDLAGAGAGAAGSLGTAGGGLGAALKAVAAVAAVSLLPAIGAVVPMMAGAGLAAGTLKLALSGVGDAVKLAGEDTEKYHEALKKMDPEQRAFTRALVALKGQFAPIGREIRKVALPGFTQAVKDAQPVVKILGDAMVGLGKGFGDAARGAGRMLQDGGFQGALQKNLQLGTVFVQDMTRAMGPFVRSFLDFGAASEPTLRAFSEGISGLLSKGLPGFFQGLENGVSGAAQFLDGLFDSINMVLPAFGRLSGEIARVTGPIFGEAFRALGMTGAGAMDMLRGGLVLVRPLFKDLAFAIKTTNDIAQIAAPTIKDLGGVLLSTFAPVGAKIDETAGPFERLNRWVNTNKASIQEASRIFAGAVIDMAATAIAVTPQIIDGFRLVSSGVLEAMEAIVVGAAKAWGWVPGLGGKMKAAADAFTGFKDTYLGGLETASRKSHQFADSALPRLEQGKLKLNISNWESQLVEAKAQLKTVPPEKRSALKATIKDLEAKIAAAKNQIGSVKGKSVTVRANTNPFTSSVGGIAGTTVANAFIRISARYDNQVAPYFRRNGGPAAPKFARGGMPNGMLRGPGTGTSDSIPLLWASNGEYIINARSTKKYLPLVKAINEDRLDAPGLAGSPGIAPVFGNLAQGIVSMMRGTFSSAAEHARTMAASALPTLGQGLGSQMGPSVAEVAAAARKAAQAEQRARANKTAAKAAREKASARAARNSTSGFSSAVAELQRLVDTGRWTKKGSKLFEDISFQGMSRNFAAQQMKVADGFWNAVYEIKKAVRAGKRVFEDMTYKGMSSNVSRFHDMIAQIWKGNPYGRNFGDWGNFGSYGRYGKYAAGGLITGPGSGTSDQVPILASNREFIVNARQTARNLPLLNAINSGQTRTAGRAGTASASLGDTNITVVVQNHGVIGSQMQMQDWLAKSLDTLVRTGRLPAALRKAVAA